jgi:hypothetical protein
MHPHLKPGTQLYIYGAPVKWSESYVVYGGKLGQAISLFYGHKGLRVYQVYDAAWTAWYYKDSFRGLPDPRHLNLDKRDLIFWYDTISGQLHDLSAKVRERVNRSAMRKAVASDLRGINQGELGMSGKWIVEEAKAGLRRAPSGNWKEAIVGLPTAWTPSVSDVLEIRLRVDWADRKVSGRKIAFVDVSWEPRDTLFMRTLAVQIPVMADGQWRTYSVAIGWYVPWLLGSPGAQLRVMPMPSATRAEIESIRLRAIGGWDQDKLSR